MSDIMHIVLSADDNYAQYLAVTIVSVLSNRASDDRLFFHVLDGGIREENRRKIIEMIEQYEAKIAFHHIDKNLFSGKVLNITEKNHVTLATYYRLLIPSLINAERCIYMDCDMICRTSLAPLWSCHLGDNIVAAVKDIDEDKQSSRLGLTHYFNAGLLLINLKYMLEKQIQKQFFQFIEEHHERILMHDQDVLNSVLHGRIYELDKTWNCQVCKTHKCKEMGFHELSRTANILHFVGRRKPWMWGCKAPQNEEYWKYEILIGHNRFNLLRILKLIKLYVR
ncbi:glycosyltransferase family 8 protein [Mailhella sp.]|uniref:glycosyltransferase family 8 protein n=1 Tax=Mailhella sp. TaxID=1981029 RepID=UPI004063940F